MKDTSEDGYKDAKDENGDPKFSLSTIGTYWPNWLIIMKDSHMIMCGCKTCNEIDGLHESMQIKRRKILHETEAKIMQMPRGREKTALERDLNEYKKEILTADGNHKHDKGWDVADQYGCGERITVQIDGKDVSFPHFSCMLG